MATPTIDEYDGWQAVVGVVMTNDDRVLVTNTE
jgi:hypothetical protein